MLAIYRVLVVLLSGLALLWLARRRPESVAPGRWRERLGRVSPAGDAPLVIHCASVGEVNAAAALIDRVRAHRPVLVTTLTATGAARVAERFGKGVAHRFLPLDTPGAVRRWLERIAPAEVWVAETEIWPELFRALAARGIPLAMFNARISPRAFRRYRRFRALAAPALAAVTRIACQTGADAERLVELGATRANLRVTGNLKFDSAPPPGLHADVASLKSQWGNRPTWVAGSTRPGEEAVLVDAHRRIREAVPDALLVIAPRHPQRAGQVERLLDGAGVRHAAFGSNVPADTPVVLVAVLGRLQTCYAAGDIAFVGGSLVPIGGHNLLEPAALGRPVLAGPHLDQQQAAAEALEATDALIPVHDAGDLSAAVVELLGDADLRDRRGTAARRVVEAGRGALARTLEWLGEAP